MDFGVLFKIFCGAMAYAVVRWLSGWLGVCHVRVLL